MTLPVEHTQPDRHHRWWPFLAIWVGGALAVGVVGYVRHLDSIGGEAIAFVFVGLVFGLVAGSGFVLLYRSGSTKPVATVLKGAVVGAIATLVYIGLDALTTFLRGGLVRIASYDLVLVGEGALLGALCAIVSRHGGTRVGTA